MHFHLGVYLGKPNAGLYSAEFLNVEDPAGTHLHACLSPIQIEISFQNLASFLPAIPLYCLGNEYHDDDGTGSSTF